MSISLWYNGLWTARLLCPWDSQGKNSEWVAMPSSTGSSRSRDWPWVSCIAGRFFTTGPSGKHPTHLREGNLFYSSLYLSVNLIQKTFSQKHPNIWAPHGPDKFTYKVNRHRRQYINMLSINWVVILSLALAFYFVISNGIFLYFNYF